jgi:hypothetical protein
MMVGWRGCAMVETRAGKMVALLDAKTADVMVVHSVGLTVASKADKSADLKVVMSAVLMDEMTAALMDDY